MIRITALCGAMALAMAAAPAQTTVALPAVRDNTLFEDATGSLSNARGQYLFAGLTAQPLKRRALLRFDIAGSLPAGAVVVDASLHLNVSRALVSAPLAISAHRVLADWGEGSSQAIGQEGSGAPATPGDATWLDRFQGSSLWQQAGGDFAAGASAVSPTPGFGPAVWRGPGLLADVAFFQQQPAQNFGWLLKGDEVMGGDVRRFDSRENQVVGNRPALRITYLLPGQFLAIGQGCPSSTNQQMSLSLVGSPVGGGSFALVHGNGPPGSLAGNLVGFGTAASPLPVYPGCDAYLNLPAVTLNLLLLDPSGGSVTPQAVPNGFRGLDLGYQGFALDLALPAGFVLSNAVRVVIG